MRVVHVPFCFHPDAVGGTEVYVEALAREQLRLGHDVVIAAPGTANAEYMAAGLQVRRFATAPRCDMDTLYGAGDSVASQYFASVLDRERPDIVHLHAFTSAVSLRLVDEAHQRSTPVVFTYHTPTVSCSRGTLLRWGHEVCDGTLDLQTCAQCSLQGLGVGRMTSAVLSRMPKALGRACGSLGLTGSLWTGVSYTHLLDLQQSTFRTLLSSVQHVVVLCDWARDVLARNGVAYHKVSVSKHALAHETARDGSLASYRRRSTGGLRVAFLGRLHPTKGPHILIQAARMIDNANLELHLFGIEQGTLGAEYSRQLRVLAGDDARIRFHAAVAGQGVVDLLSHFDVLAVPSQWLETGPLVVLEAFAAGIPVIGSNLGGIAEQVRNGVDGLLVAHDSSEEWSHMLRRLADDPTFLASLRAGVRPPRHMSIVADEMQQIYGRVIQQDRARFAAVVGGPAW